MLIKKLQIFIRQKLSSVTNSDSLRYRAIRASSWTIGGQLTSQLLRLAGNLVLTRLLFPEAFGLMVIVQSLMIGLAMLSDLGIEASIVQNKRGHEAVFVNSAWTIQVIQGVFIWIALCLISQIAALIYAEPILGSLVPVVGFCAVIGGLTSTNMALSNRALDLKRRVLIETGSYFIGLLVTIIWAWVDHSVWSLAGGGLFSAFIKMIASHVVLRGVKNKFVLERSAVNTLFTFGQWILVGSILTFLAGEGNKLLLGAFLGVQLLALFNLASTMSSLLWQITQQLSSKVLFPAYSEVARDRPERVRIVVARSRLILIIPGWALALFFVLWGDHLMWVLYDQRYAKSGYILQMLAMGQLIGVIGGAYTGLLLAKGMVKASTMLLTAQIIIQILGMVVGNYFLGERGVILSAAATSWLIYPVTAYVHAKIGLWQPKIDLPFVAISITVVMLNFNNIYWHV